VNDVIVGRIVRAVRRRRGWRQIDVARPAGVSQQLTSLIELGRLEQVSLGMLRSVARALDIDLPLAPRWRGPELDRLLDAEHATLVDAAVAVFAASGWVVTVEWSFNHFGERGAVDIVGWHAGRRALAIVEVKSRIVDVQDLLGKLDRKVRVARELLPGERAWTPERLGRILVLPDTSTARDSIARLARTFDVSLPARTVETRRWLRDPGQDLESVWFLRATRHSGGRSVPRQAPVASGSTARSALSRNTRDTNPGRATQLPDPHIPASMVSRQDGRAGEG
jgi:transcriptional regulator with XRE-family HTH domain